uniref:Uncharacterized protein n=1 Tax=Ciona intestinalis TaxID=7719 RepID=H2XQP3_CIOIN
MFTLKSGRCGQRMKMRICFYKAKDFCLLQVESMKNLIGTIIIIVFG